jgi:hypothetical protein
VSEKTNKQTENNNELNKIEAIENKTERNTDIDKDIVNAKKLKQSVSNLD